MAIIEIRCPKCGASCNLIDKEKNEYECTHCGSTFRFVDTQKVLHIVQRAFCPNCGSPTRAGGFRCTICERENFCERHIYYVSSSGKIVPRAEDLFGKYVCIECYGKKYGQTKTASSQNDAKCSRCGGPLTYIPQTKAWYCYRDNRYEGSTEPAVINGKAICPKCGCPLTYIKEYGRWYCYNDKMYA